MKHYPPSIVAYNTVLSAYARAGNAKRADGLLDKMKTIPDLLPNAQSYAIVMSAWDHVGTFQAAERAEYLLTIAMPKAGLSPNLQAFSNCISAWSRVANSRDNTAINRGKVLWDMLGQSPDDLVPDIVTYTAWLTIWSRSGRPEETESILEAMLQEYSLNHSPRLKPNVQVFTPVLTAWAHSKGADDAAERVERWLKRMKTEYGVNPNVISYSVALDAWARSPIREGADRARGILDWLQSSERASLRPNIVSYTSVLHAYARRGQAGKAETLLNEMIRRDELPEPDTRSYSALLHAFQKSRDHDAALKAEALLGKMHMLYHDGSLSTPPTVFCYSSVLASWAKIGHADRAEAILQFMQHQSGVRPNIVCYNSMLNAWANHVAANSAEFDAGLDRMKFWLNDLESNGLSPDEYTFLAFLKTIHTNKSTDTRNHLEWAFQKMSHHGIPVTRAMQRYI